jgi:hypothetical protein
MRMGEKTVLHDAIEVLFRSNFRRDSHSLVMSYAGAAPNHWHHDGYELISYVLTSSFNVFFIHQIVHIIGHTSSTRMEKESLTNCLCTR